MGKTHPLHKDSIWVLDPASLDDTHANLTNLPETTPSTGRWAGQATDLEVWNQDDDVQGLLVLRGDKLLVMSFPAGGHAAPPVELLGFPPMMRALDIRIADVADVPGALDSRELLVATETGYVSWVSLDEIASGGTVLPIGSRVLPFAHTDVRKRGIGSGTQQSPNLASAPAHCNRTLAATWGMFANMSTTPRTLEVIDQSGSRWSVKANGEVTFVHEVTWNSRFPPAPTPIDQCSFLPMPGPFRGLAKLSPPSPTTGTHVVTRPAAANFSAPVGILPALVPASSTVDIMTFPFVPEDSRGFTFGGQWRSGDRDRTHHLYSHSGLAVFPKGGDVLEHPAGVRHAAWWAGEEHHGLASFGDRVQGVRLTDTSVLGWWSTATTGDNHGTMTSAASSTNVSGHHLRALVSTPEAFHNAQCLRLFVDPVTNDVLCAVNTPSARLHVIRPGTETSPGPVIEGDNFDYGTGGMALAVKPALPGESTVDLYVGAAAFYNDRAPHVAGAACDTVSVIAAVRFNGSGPSLQETNRIVLAGTPKVYGVCGMAVGDVVPDTINPGRELVVTSLMGHLLVFALDPISGAIGSTPIYQAQVDGALGVYSSIVIADLDGVGGNELYVAGSLGLRKWIP